MRYAEPEMQLTPEQGRFFKTFGFLHLPGAMKNDLPWIVDAFEAAHRASGRRHDGEKATTIELFIDLDDRLCSLVEHPVVSGIAESLLGADFNFLTGDGNYFVGDTPWHSDDWTDAASTYVKIAFYLDPLTRDSGALRFIPGSHIIADAFSQGAQQVVNAQESFGRHGRDLPSVAIATEPGDLVVFNRNIKHATFGGSSRRRLFTLLFCEHCRTPEQIAILKKYLADHIAPYSAQTHSDRMRRTATPQRMRHLRQVIEIEGGRTEPR